ncbi:hypothetical protein BJ508DRAFT_124873 [Ascobolus immersus RN42]|uniref:Uncharacterized protein n=1 Tax=Ascobolus immersus RN42 TaxID=1160509 RepID=A0A3N4I3W3_ASCIM|nr:hypothetical protein BJ508DRAFT_124873 [Ascobolus immersus RN42]
MTTLDIRRQPYRGRSHLRNLLQSCTSTSPAVLHSFISTQYCFSFLLSSSTYSILLVYRRKPRRKGTHNTTLVDIDMRYPSEIKLADRNEEIYGGCSRSAIDISHRKNSPKH